MPKNKKRRSRSKKKVTAKKLCNNLAKSIRDDCEKRKIGYQKEFKHPMSQEAFDAWNKIYPGFYKADEVEIIPPNLFSDCIQEENS